MKVKKNRKESSKIICSICKNFDKKNCKCKLNYNDEYNVNFNKDTNNFEVSFCKDYITNEKYVYF